MALKFSKYYITNLFNWKKKYSSNKLTEFSVQSRGSKCCFGLIWKESGSDPEAHLVYVTAIEDVSHKIYSSLFLKTFCSLKEPMKEFFGLTLWLSLYCLTLSSVGFLTQHSFHSSFSHDLSGNKTNKTRHSTEYILFLDVD